VATQSTSAPALRRLGALRAFDWRRYVIYIGFVAIFLTFAVTLHDDGFLTKTNLTNIVTQTTTITVMAVAMTFVIAAAEIDLSVGALAGLASVTTAMSISHWGVAVGILAGLGTGLLVGSINGLLVTAFAIPSFLVTLGMSLVALGVGMWITATAPQPIFESAFYNPFGAGHILGIQSLVFWTIAFVVVGAVVLRKTRYGRQVLATGGNRIAAEFTGVNTKRIKFTVLAVSGVVAAFAGMLYAGHLRTGRFQWGQGDELSVIAAVILGGTSLFGGSGAVVGAFFGSLLIGLINNGLILAGLDVSQQYVIRGFIIILAVALARRK
jgi:ribose transport system permease protein